ncbi:hypothetical protein [Alkalihalobacillus sp. CinArs1]|uniref:hypothetical protein n=1 Tax=Alkalihalobacillus sp. CinArs1 TaxID=2995314 RepID=UPI0022DE85A8|nr:hypothetical protein [Alkalihalobacillus sp. CinArs1]
MNLLRGTILVVLSLCIVLAIGTAFANEQKDELVFVTGEVQKKMVRYEEPQLTEKTNDKSGNDEETIDAVEKPYFYLIVNKTPYLADESKWNKVDEGDHVTIGYEPGNVHRLKTIDEE